MQQTEKYKLNLIESSDPFLPEGLNENTQKVEDVLAAREALSDERLADMDQRVTVLEAHQFFVGTYTGDGQLSQEIHLGFTPLAVCVGSISGSNYIANWAYTGNNSYGVGIIEGGFKVSTSFAASTNNSGVTYSYLLIT